MHLINCTPTLPWRHFLKYLVNELSVFKYSKSFSSFLFVSSKMTFKNLSCFISSVQIILFLLKLMWIMLIFYNNSGHYICSFTFYFICTAYFFVDFPPKPKFPPLVTLITIFPYFSNMCVRLFTRKLTLWVFLIVDWFPNSNNVRQFMQAMMVID